jgi:hypothetical protein
MRLLRGPLEQRRSIQASSLSSKARARARRSDTSPTWFEGYTDAFSLGLRANRAMKAAAENQGAGPASNRLLPMRPTTVRIVSRHRPQTRIAKLRYATGVRALSSPCAEAEEDAVAAVDVAKHPPPR